MPHVAEYSAFAFDCTLRGPFADLFLTRLSAWRALCEVMIDVISASTVYDSISIAREKGFVNRKSKKTLPLSRRKRTAKMPPFRNAMAPHDPKEGCPVFCKELMFSQSIPAFLFLKIRRLPREFPRQRVLVQEARWDRYHQQPP